MCERQGQRQKYGETEDETQRHRDRDRAQDKESERESKKEREDAREGGTNRLIRNKKGECKSFLLVLHRWCEKVVMSRVC